MNRKLRFAQALALVAGLVLVFQGTALASPVLTETLAKVVNGQKVQATNAANATITTTGGAGEDKGTITCNASTLTGNVAINEKNKIELTIETAKFTGPKAGGNCEWGMGEASVTALNLHWCFTTTMFGAFTIRGGGCNEAVRNLKFRIQSFEECVYEAVNLTGKYVGEDNGGTEATKLNITNQPFTHTGGSGFTCPASFDLTTSYTLETDANPATALTIS